MMNGTVIVPAAMERHGSSDRRVHFGPNVVGRRIKAARRDSGFFYQTRRGVPNALIAELDWTARAFLARLGRRRHPLASTGGRQPPAPLKRR
jgi:hypothetical protein